MGFFFGMFCQDFDGYYEILDEPASLVELYGHLWYMNSSLRVILYVVREFVV